MTEIEINNFQSIKKAQFSIDGFTVIVGKNNIGKSAIIRSIEAALTNQAGSGYIRKGEKATKVKIRKDNFDLTWEKGLSASYKINGETFKKLNRDVPAPLLEAGFTKIDMGEKNFPLVASQFEPLFLLNKPGSTITEVLTSWYNIDTLSIADDLCQKELKANKTLLKTRENDLKSLQEKLDKFKDFEKIKKAVSDILIDDEHKKRLELEIADLESFENKLKSLSESLIKLKPISKINIPNISKYEESFQEIGIIQRLEKEYIATSTYVNKLKGVNSLKVPQLKETEELSKETQCLIKWEETFTNLKKKVKAKKDTLETIDTKKISLLYKNTEEIINELNFIEYARKEFNVLAVSAKTTRDQLKKVTEEYDKKYETLSKTICPTCKRPYAD